jgi:hypothetical protein
MPVAGLWIVIVLKKKIFLANRFFKAKWFTDYCSHVIMTPQQKARGLLFFGTKI